MRVEFVTVPMGGEQLKSNMRWVWLEMEGATNEEEDKIELVGLMKEMTRRRVKHDDTHSAQSEEEIRDKKIAKRSSCMRKQEKNNSANHTTPRAAGLSQKLAAAEKDELKALSS